MVRASLTQGNDMHGQEKQVEISVNWSMKTLKPNGEDTHVGCDFTS